MDQEHTEIWTVRDVAQWLKVSDHTVLRAARAGELPGARKVRKAWRFSRPVLQEWFAQREGPEDSASEVSS